MKKFVIILLIACLALGCGLGYFAAKNSAEPSPAPAAETEEPAPAEEGANAVTAPAAEESAGDAAAEETPVRTLDLAAIRALHAPDEIVGDIDGREVSWDEYYYWIAEMGSQAQNYIYTMAMYGQSLDWDDKLSDESVLTIRLRSGENHPPRASDLHLET